MNIRELQAALNARASKPTLVEDGLLGRKTLAAVDALLASVSGLVYAKWADERRLVAAEQVLMKAAGIEVGKIDGLVGPQTRYAREVWAARKAGDKTVETWRDKEVAPATPAASPSKTVWPTQKDVPAFFGEVGKHQTSIELPIPFRIAWAPSTSVRKVSCHEKVAEPMKRIWANAVAHFGEARFRELRLDMFGGCLNVRKMRGGSAYSMHSWGIAWDIDPDRNQLKWGRDLASLDGLDYEPFWKIVESEGALSLGRTRNYDWMHFQFARL